MAAVERGVSCLSTQTNRMAVCTTTPTVSPSTAMMYQAATASTDLPSVSPQIMVGNPAWSKSDFGRHMFECACNEAACKAATKEWCMAVGHPLPIVRISKQSYRDHLRENKTWQNAKLLTVVSKLRLHHYDIHLRHYAYRRGDMQFTQTGVYITPEMSHEQTMLEARLAKRVKDLNPKLYDEKIRPSLVGRGDGTFTFEDLVMEYNNLRLDAGRTPFRTVTQNGSMLIRNVLQSLPTRSLRQIPKDFLEDEYLAYHIRSCQESTPLPTRQASRHITVRMPQSVFSRRATARQRQMVEIQYMGMEDLVLTLPTNVEELMICTIPMNESASKEDTASRIKRDGIVTFEKLIAQGQKLTQVKLMQCYNEDKEQYFYIDEHEILPSITARGRRHNRSRWNKAHYFVVGDVLERGEVEAALEFCREYNIEYLPVVLLFMFRFKGARNSKQNKNKETQKSIEGYGADKTISAAIDTFEYFFEDLAEAFLSNVHMLHFSDMERFSWFTWNIWNENCDDAYDEAGKAQRATTRRLAGSQVNEAQRKSFLLLHYFTIMLHTQRMRDKNAERLYTQLSTNVPTNETCLALVRGMSFYELYYLLTNKIFTKYGMHSMSAEAEISKILIIKVMYNNSIPANDDLLGMYQCDFKKFIISLNEYNRDTMTNPHCVAAGQDRHVTSLAQQFAPEGLLTTPSFPRIVCARSKDWIRWNLNEIAGELTQSIHSNDATRRGRFAAATLIDVLLYNPEHAIIVRRILKPKQWHALENILHLRGRASSNRLNFN